MKRRTIYSPRSLYDPCFHEVAQRWLETEQLLLKASSIVKYRNILNKYLLPEFGDCTLSAITRDRVTQFLAKLLPNRAALPASGEPPLARNAGIPPSPAQCSSRTVTAILSVLKSILRYAEYSMDLQVSDLCGLTVRKSQKSLRVFSSIEQRKLSSCLLNDLSLSNLGILLTLYTGLRIGELCALKWSDISFSNGCLYVRRTMQRLQLPDTESRTVIHISTPKSPSSVRTIPLPDELLSLLRSAERSGDAYLLTGKTDEFIEPRTMENRFKRILEQLGITDATFHTLRHTFATRCVELGFDIKSLSEVLGHSSVNITMNRYVHPSMEFKRANMNRLSSLIQG